MDRKEALLAHRRKMALEYWDRDRMLASKSDRVSWLTSEADQPKKGRLSPGYPGCVKSNAPLIGGCFL
jgi:hypothetical protein